MRKAATWVADVTRLRWGPATCPSQCRLPRGSTRTYWPTYCLIPSPPSALKRIFHRVPSGALCSALGGPLGLRALAVAPICTRVSDRGTLFNLPSRTPAALVRHAPTFGGFIPAPGPTAAVGRVGVAKHRLGSRFRCQNQHRPPPSGPSSDSNHKIVIQNSVLNHDF